MIKGIRRLTCIIIAMVPTHSPLQSGQSITVYAHGFDNHPGRYQARNLIYAPADTTPVTIRFQHKLICFGVKGQDEIKKTLEGQESKPTSFISFSQGTAATLHYLGNKNDSSNIRSIILNAPFADPREVTQDRSIMKYIFMPQWITSIILDIKFKYYDPDIAPPIKQIERIKNLSKNCPVIIIHGTNDETLNWMQGYKVAKKFYSLGHTVYFIEHDGDHNDPHDQKLAEQRKQEIAQISTDFTNEEQKAKIIEIHKRVSQKAREKIVRKVNAIYRKHGIPCQHEKPGKLINADDYSFENQSKQLDRRCLMNLSIGFLERILVIIIILSCCFGIRRFFF